MTLSEFLQVFFTAAAPISELRGAIPLGIEVHDISWPIVFVVAIAGNLLPVPFLLLFLDPVTRLLSKVKLFERIINWFFERTRKRGKFIERYERIGLTLFVAIPLPITGAWTGSILAFLLGLSFWRAFISIALGILIAGAIVTALTMIGWWGAAIAGVSLGVLVIIGLRKS
ncbi:MAG TPA: small multi-drug export protein [Dehalococcoidia bacterium]|nr:small multi-drug export protein [Dehalococcoidia bacterium]